MTRSLIQLRALVGRRPEAQFELLRMADNLAELMPKIAAQDLHALVCSVGKEEFLDLVPTCSAEQLIALTDLEGWRASRFDHMGFEDWLGVLVEAGPRHLQRYLKAMDLEQMLLYLCGRVRVHARAEQEDDGYPTLPNEVPGSALWWSPDRRFVLEIFDWKKGEDRFQTDPIRPLLRHLETRDAWEVSRLLVALSWELATPLEEDCLRLRNARMEELGFPPAEEAWVLYAPGRPDHLLAQGKGRVADPVAGEVAALVLRVRSSEDPLQAALEELPETVAAIVVQQLAYTSNRALVADGVSPGEVDAVAASALRVRSTVCLGLGYALARSPEGSPGKLVLRHGVQTLFRVGYNLCLPLAEMAREICRNPASGPGDQAHWLAPSAEHMLAGLLLPRPMLATGRDRCRPLANLGDVQKVAARLTGLVDLLAGIFCDGVEPGHLFDAELAGTNLAQVEDFDLVGVQRTLEAHEALGNGRVIQPLMPSELVRLVKILTPENPVAKMLSGGCDPRFVLPLWARLEDNNV
jgi:hypothetical protein